jgi:predicted AAA+ superfamily ATPase
MKDFKPRLLTSKLKLARKVMPVVAITGARQTGKTTLVQSLDPKIPYYTLDDLGILEQAEKSPETLLLQRPVTIDEVQRAPALLSAVKREVDKLRKPGDFLLTGSANLLLMKGVSESLAGRAVYFDLPPFCPVEWLEKKDPLRPLDKLFEDNFDLKKDWPEGKGDFPKWLLKGGFPSAIENDSDKERSVWFSAYTQTYLERDLRQLSEVSSLSDFQRLMRIAAQRTGKIINQADLARDAALSHPTAHRYLNLLETGCLLSRLAPYASNLTTSMVKSPKLLWTDCGLAASLAGISDRASLKKRDDLGFWLEQAIFQTLQVWKAIDTDKRRLYFWRDKNSNEVDFILEQEGELVALELKTASSVGPSDAKGLVAFREALKKQKVLKRSIVLHGGDTGRQLGDDLFALPWGWMTPEV